MKTTTETTTKEFTPKEAAAVSGVSQTLQRDWRRRGLLPETKKDGWAAFTLENVIEMTVMKALSDGGLSIQKAQHYSFMAVMPTLEKIKTFTDVVSFDGDEIPQKLKDAMIHSIARSSTYNEYLFASLPQTDNNPGPALFDDISIIPKILDESSDFYGVLIDHSLLAKRIVKRAGLPLFHIICTKKKD